MFRVCWRVRMRLCVCLYLSLSLSLFLSLTPTNPHTHPPYTHTQPTTHLHSGTASDDIQVWLSNRSTVSSGSCSGSDGSSSGSCRDEGSGGVSITGAIKVADPSQARQLYDAGHSLYVPPPLPSLPFSFSLSFSFFLSLSLSLPFSHSR